MHFFFFLTTLFISGTSCFAADVSTLVWTKQLGTAATDATNGVAMDTAGNVFITGSTNGNLDGNISAGGEDIFLSKFGANGRKYWTRQVGSADNDVGYGVTTDSAGYIYVAGTIGGDGSLNNGDIVVLKYDTNGNRIWLSRSSPGGTSDAYGIIADNTGNIYVTGLTSGNLDGNTSLGGSDIFLIKYDSDGNKIWTRQTGTSDDDIPKGVAVDGAGNVYLAGYTYGNMAGTNQGGADIFILKYDTGGNKIWTRQIGTAQDDLANALTADTTGYLYITGYTAGGLDSNSNQGGKDIILLKYDTDGNKIWTRQTGTDQDDAGTGVTVNNSGYIFITGYTQGGLDGKTNAGLSDIFTLKYDNLGNKIWTQQTGTNTNDAGNGIATDSTGNVYVCGYTVNGLNGNSLQGGTDAFVLKYNSDKTLLLSWPAETNYDQGGLYPTFGNDSTVFTFKVVYTDVGNSAPKSGYPRLHIEKGGQEISGSPVTLLETDASALDFTIGKTYQYQSALPLGNDYAYWFESLNTAGAAAGGIPTGIISGPAVETTSLSAVYTYPNPAKAGKINFHVFCGYTDPDLTIRIYDLNGDKVATIGNDKFDGSQKPNYYFRNWDCRNDAGNKLASGVYIYRVEAHDASTNDHAEATNKFAIIK